MSISDKEEAKYKWQKTEERYFCISLFCILFGAVYEVFSYGVFSFYMIYAFVIPLTVGCVMQGILEIYGTTNGLTCMYWSVGSSFVVIGGGIYLLREKM